MFLWFFLYILSKWMPCSSWNHKTKIIPRTINDKQNLMLWVEAFTEQHSLKPQQDVFCVN